MRVDQAVKEEPWVHLTEENDLTDRILVPQQSRKHSDTTVYLASEDITSQMVVEAAVKVAKMYEIADRHNKEALTFSDITKYSLYPKRPGMNAKNFIEVFIKLKNKNQ